MKTMMRMRLRSTIHALPAGSSSLDQTHSPTHPRALVTQHSQVLVILLAGQQRGDRHSVTLTRNIAHSMLSLHTTKQTTTKPSEPVSRPY